MSLKLYLQLSGVLILKVWEHNSFGQLLKLLKVLLQTQSIAVTWLGK